MCALAYPSIRRGAGTARFVFGRCRRPRAKHRRARPPPRRRSPAPYDRGAGLSAAPSRGKRARVPDGGVTRADERTNGAPQGRAPCTGHVQLSRATASLPCDRTRGPCDGMAVRADRGYADVIALAASRVCHPTGARDRVERARESGRSREFNFEASVRVTCGEFERIWAEAWSRERASRGPIVVEDQSTRPLPPRAEHWHPATTSPQSWWSRWLAQLACGSMQPHYRSVRARLSDRRYMLNQ